MRASCKAHLSCLEASQKAHFFFSLLIERNQLTSRTMEILGNNKIIDVLMWKTHFTFREIERMVVHQPPDCEKIMKLIFLHKRPEVLNTKKFLERMKNGMGEEIQSLKQVYGFNQDGPMTVQQIIHVMQQFLLIEKNYPDFVYTMVDLNVTHPKRLGMVGTGSGGGHLKDAGQVSSMWLAGHLIFGCNWMGTGDSWEKVLGAAPLLVDEHAKLVPNWKKKMLQVLQAFAKTENEAKAEPTSKKNKQVDAKEPPSKRSKKTTTSDDESATESDEDHVESP